MNERTESFLPWFTPADRAARIISFDEIGSSKSDISTLVEVCQFIRKSRADKRLIVQLPRAPSASLSCPSLEEVYLAILKENTMFTVHSLDGYNFSAEYAHIYRLRSEKSFYPLDVVSVCQRAILSHDPFLKHAKKCSEFIVKIAYWEAIKLEATADSSFAAIFPIVKAVSTKDRFYGARIYIGHSSMDHALCCFIRMNCGIKSVSDNVDIIVEREQETATCIQFITYKKIVLSEENLEKIDDSLNFEDAMEGEQTSRTAADLANANPIHDDTELLYLSILTPEEEYKAGTNSSADTSNTWDEDDQNQANSNGDSHEEITPKKVSLFQFVFNNCIHLFMMTFLFLFKVELPPLEFVTKKNYINNQCSGEPSPCSELLVWGSNNFSCIGPKESIITEPTPMPRPLSLCLERVKMVACSARHTLVLTTLGLVYACGDNTEGALGSGDVNSRSKLQLLAKWFHAAVLSETDPSLSGDSFNSKPIILSEAPPVIVQISAGAGIIGSHSMAICDKGNLYGWGVGQATGHGIS